MNMNTNTRTKPRRGGFTLVEMLVVIAIIGILAAILVPTLYVVVMRAQRNHIAQELNQLYMAVEAYKQKFGDYPPDFSSITQASDLNDTSNIVVRHFRKAFPRHKEDLKTYFTDNGNLNVPDASQALAFWLSGSKLNNDPRKPLTGSGDPIVLLDFDKSRLEDDGDWASYLPKYSDAPYVYFDSRTYSDVSYTNSATSGDETVRPYKFQPEGSTDIDWAKENTFQIISAGLDGEFGDTDSGKNKRFPDGTADSSSSIVGYEDGDYDNQSNFSDGRILEDHIIE